jgi:lipoprotein-anchoring transpeptidase ErfK/SrfK
VTSEVLELRRQAREMHAQSRRADPAQADAGDVSQEGATDDVQVPAPQGKALVVDQAAQVVRVYEDGVEICTLPASTGVPPLYTPAFRGHVGYFAGTIYGHGSWADDAWYVFRAGGNIYLHGLPYTTSEDEKAYTGGEFLGVRPASHGCIRLAPADARWLTRWDPGGVPIVVTPPQLDREW